MALVRLADTEDLDVIEWFAGFIFQGLNWVIRRPFGSRMMQNWLFDPTLSRARAALGGCLTSQDPSQFFALVGGAAG